MKLWLYIVSAVAAYLVGSVNPAIILSRAIYRVDVRGFGSHNPGFTNFKRVFGNDHAWTVFLLDFLKSAILCAIFGWLFRRGGGSYSLGAAFTALFVLLGHAYPVWYRFQGGKGAAVMGGAIWFIDWRVALVGFGVLFIVMFTTRYMSLSVMCAAVSLPVALAVFGWEHPAALILLAACSLFVIVRHRENIGRLLRGTESKFSLKSIRAKDTDEGA